jgi:rubredoxin
VVPGDKPKQARNEPDLQFECPVCASGHYEPLVVNRPDGSTSTLNFFRCKNCGYAFSDPSLHRKKPL